MIASQVFAYGDIQTLSYSSQTPSTFSSDKSLIASSIPNEALYVENNHESHPNYQTTSRDLQSFDIFRDNNLIATVGADVYSYRDEPLNNMTEYCYTLGSNYYE